ncbi:MAG: hypothetical protein ACLTMP_09145 [Eggerthella lenta]
MKILEYLSKHTGLSFEVVSIPRYDDLPALRRENIDIVAGVTTTTIQKSTRSSHDGSVPDHLHTAGIQQVRNPDRLDSESITLLWDKAETALKARRCRCTAPLRNAFRQ